jgi:hypothetical protein
MVDTSKNCSPDNYCGRLLLENYSDSLKDKVREQIAACFSFLITIELQPA